MKLKAIFTKTVEVTDYLSDEELEQVKKDNVAPERFELMADAIDNEQPLEFKSFTILEEDN